MLLGGRLLHFLVFMKMPETALFPKLFQNTYIYIFKSYFTFVRIHEKQFLNNSIPQLYIKKLGIHQQRYTTKEQHVAKTITHLLPPDPW